MIHTHTLSNGLRIIHNSFPSEISYCGIVVNTGSRDENPDEFGMAHFVEHMLFKGTTKRKAHHISNRMENVGGELNAYTTKEETFFYATFLEEFFPRATELLGDMLFHSVFPPHQLEREVAVVLDEINSYLDTPSDLIFDDFENMLFSGHAMGHSILGETETLLSFDREDILRFMKRQYALQEMVFFSFGKTPFEKVLRMAEKHFCATGGAMQQKKRIQPVVAAPHTEKVARNTTQTHVMLGGDTFSMYHPHRYALFLMNNILGGGANSRLNTSLREKHGLAYQVESNFNLYTDNGLFSVYFACDPKYRDKCIRLVRKEILKMKETMLTPMQLALAKKQWKGQRGIEAESNEYSALSMAKQYLHFHYYTPLEEIFSRIEAVTPLQVQEVAQEIFATPSFELIYY